MGNVTVIFSRDANGMLGANVDGDGRTQDKLSRVVMNCMSYAPLLSVYTGGNCEEYDSWTDIGDINECGFGHELFDNLSYATPNNQLLSGEIIAGISSSQHVKGDDGMTREYSASSTKREIYPEYLLQDYATRKM